MPSSIFIVDDESIIREGLIDSIEWEKYGFQIAGEAANGEEALDKILRLNPDIIITDIRMPKMDGLELCEKIKALGITSKIVILTGYSDFEYAKRAVRLNVFDYLMKPVGADELIRIMLKLEKTIQFEKNKNREFEDSQSFLEANLSGLRRNFIISLIEGEKLNTDLQSTIANLKFPDAERYFHLVIFSIDKYITAIVETSNYSLIEDAVGIIETEMKAFDPGIVLYFKENLIISITNSADKHINELSRIFKSVSLKVFTELNLKIKGFYGKAFENILDIRESYRAVERVLMYRLFFVNPGLYSGEDLKPIIARPEYVYPADIENEILMYLLDLDFDVIRQKIMNFFSLLRNSNAPYHTARTAVSKVMNVILEHLQHIDTNINQILGYQFDPYMEFKKFDYFSEIEAWVTGFTANLVDVVLSNQSSKYKFVIQKAIQYVETHYYEEITLKSIADEVHVTPNYLSKVFKEETGANFKDWLNQFRLNKAKSLLKNSFLKIYEIAEKSGYSSYKYFIQTFRKYNNCTPKQFRKRNLF